ncbi:MAG: hypothetical protein AABN34_09665 [Acidobacteriota bacterium]
MPALIVLSAMAGTASPSRSKSKAPAPAPSAMQTAAALPEVLMGATRRDFGDVFAGEELEQNFPVRNVGTKPLELAEKPTLGMRPTAPGYPVTEAAWRPHGALLSRTVAAVRAAPS